MNEKNDKNDQNDRNDQEEKKELEKREQLWCVIVETVVAIIVFSIFGYAIYLAEKKEPTRGVLYWQKEDIHNKQK